MKDNIFLDVSDGTSSQNLQVVCSKTITPKNLAYGCSIEAEGKMFTAPNGRAELNAEKILVIGEESLENYPFAPRKQYAADYVRQYLHLRPRTRTFSSILRLRNLADQAIREHFKSRDFIYIHTPIFTANDCEGAGEVFVVEPDSTELIMQMKKKDESNSKLAYFGTKAYLSVSGQFHLEACAR